VTPRTTTIFTWGYWGWGTATREFVRSVDAVEADRGFAPPHFVDIRISRSVRAPGFNGTAFERLVGRDRYTWMPSLGNRAIVEGGRQRIVQPSAAGQLLLLARQAAREQRRIIFYCACPIPAHCHRSTVAGLVLGAARRDGRRIEVVEWPGGTPLRELKLRRPRINTTAAKSVPLGHRPDLTELGSVPWYSVASFESSEPDAQPRFFTGPAIFERRRGWLLPRLEEVPERLDERGLALLADRRRRSSGRERRRS
jgi:hypothetical protein